MKQRVVREDRRSPVPVVTSLTGSRAVISLALIQNVDVPVRPVRPASPGKHDPSQLPWFISVWTR